MELIVDVNRALTSNCNYYLGLFLVKMIFYL